MPASEPKRRMSRGECTELIQPIFLTVNSCFQSEAVIQ